MRKLLFTVSLLVMASCDPITEKVSEIVVVPGEGPATCDNYCAQITDPEVCGGEFTQYNGRKDVCLDDCRDHARFEAGQVENVDENTIGCRIYHLGNIAADPSDTPQKHCLHAGVTGANLCGSFCDNYCDLMANNCLEELENDFGSAQDCVDQCRDTLSSDGSIGDLDGDTVQCRLSYALLAGRESNECNSARPFNSVEGLDAGRCIDEFLPVED